MTRVKSAKLVHLIATTVLYMSVTLQLELTEGAYVDTNTVYNPCNSSGARSIKDAITIGVAINGDISTWYNNSDVRLNLLSPCGSPLDDKFSQASIAIFRPQIDQLTMLSINNNSILSLSETFLQSMSLVLFAQGMNTTIVTPPRSFMSLYGIVSSLTTVMDFDSGVVNNFTWRDDDCTVCGTESNACLSNNCVDPDDICTNASVNNSCSFSINLAFSGTDKNKQTLKSWYQIANTEKYSLTAIYLKVKNDLTTSITDIDNRVDNGV